MLEKYHTELSAGLVSTRMILFIEVVSLHMQLYMSLHSTAGQVGTSALTNIWLALLQAIIIGIILVVMPSGIVI